MTKEEIEKRQKDLEKERKTLEENIRSGKLEGDAAEDAITEFKTRKQALDQQIAQAMNPASEHGETFDLTQVRKNLLEQRAITIPTELGGQTLVTEIVEEMKAKTSLLSLVSTFQGSNAKTTIPLLHPGLAAPAGKTEGEKNINEDSTAKLDVTEVSPRPFVSLLPVSLDTLKFNKIGFEKILPKLFADAFSQCFHKQIIKGAGDSAKEFEGLTKITFKAKKTVTAETQDKITVMDLAALALEIADKTDTGYMIMHPTVYSKIMADSPEKDLSAVYLEQLIKEKSIEGVKIILTSHMAKETTAGSVAVIAGDLKKYGVGIAGDLSITPKTKVGDLNVYFEAVLYANGKPIINDFYALKTK